VGGQIYRGRSTQASTGVGSGQVFVGSLVHVVRDVEATVSNARAQLGRIV
jgi:hypothetical protein